MRTHWLPLMIGLALCMAASAQNTSEKLQNLYGDPIGHVYRVADDVIVTTTLAPNKNVCVARIEHQAHGRRLTDSETDQVLKKVAPTTDRGEYIMGTFENVICPPDNDCSGVSEEYKRLTIRKTGNTNEYRFVSIIYHRPECDTPNPPQRESPK